MSSRLASVVSQPHKKSDREKDKSPKSPSPEPVEEKKRIDMANTKAGGAYIPPAKLRLMQQKIEDKSSEQYQRLAWELLKKRILGHVNRANVENINQVVVGLLEENIIRGKGLFARAVLQAQAFSPAFSNVYAALVAVVNSRFPHIGELVLKRLTIQFKRAFRNNDKKVSMTALKFIAHLINQNVAHEVLALELLHLLLESPTDDSVELAIGFLKESGAKLTEVSPRGVDGIFNRLRAILHESDIDKRVQYAIEVVFSVRKDKFQSYPAIVKGYTKEDGTYVSGLDLVQDEDQITHMVSLDDPMDPENMLNIFRYDPDYIKNEEMYNEIKTEMFEESSDEEEEGEDDDEKGDKGAAPTQQVTILDNTETNLVAFRRTVYLTIQSSMVFEEAIHKLLRMEIKPGMEVELCHMILDCCAQQRTYEKFYGLMAERFCRLKKQYQEHFEQIFKDTYDTIHRFEMTKMRNTAYLFAHLLYTDAISWTVLGHMKLNEDDSTSAGRIFIKYLFQTLTEVLHEKKMCERIEDPTLQVAFDGLFPRDNPRDTIFAINFFNNIGLGGLTNHLVVHLKKGPMQEKLVTLPQVPIETVKKESLDSILKVSNVQSSTESESDSSSSSSSDDSRKRKRKRREKHRSSHKGHRSKTTKVKREKISPDRRKKRRNS